MKEIPKEWVLITCEQCGSDAGICLNDVNGKYKCQECLRWFNG